MIKLFGYAKQLLTKSAMKCLVPIVFSIFQTPMRKNKSIQKSSVSIIACIVLMLFGATVFSFTENPPIIISPDDGEVMLTNQVNYFSDEQSQLSFDEVRAITDWKSSSENSLNFGYNTCAHWMKFSLSIKPGFGAMNQLLVINYPVLDSIDIYYRVDSSAWKIVHTGDHYLYSSRIYNYRHFVIPFRLSDRSPTEFYIRVRTNSSAQIPLQLWSEKAFTQHINKENYVLGIYYGIIIVMLLYNMFIYFSVREKSYLYYLCFILFFGLFQATINGFTYEYFWGDSIWWANNSVIFFAATFLFFIPTFANALLNTKVTAPKWGKILLFLGYLALINMVCSILLPYAMVVKSTVILALITVSVTVITGFFCLARGYRAARFFLLAWVGLLAGGFIYALKGVGLLPHNFFTEYAVQMGSAAEVILLSLALADRINMLKREKAEAQEKALFYLESIVQARTHQVVQQKEIIEIKNKDILSSIQYAKRIQEAILPSPGYIKKFLPENFVMYKPKDIVAGDFYWMHVTGQEEDSTVDSFNVNSLILIASCDCTGHGVPGALVSVVCHNALNRAVREFNLTSPAEILNKTRELVIGSFEKSEKDVNDGMDISLCAIDFSKMKLEFSGANNPLFLIQGDEQIELKADSQPIGKFLRTLPFTNQTIDLKKGDSIYLYTDGFSDQFGGPEGKKFKRSRLKDLLKNNSSKSMQEQQINLLAEFENWRGDLEQIDDVCVIGVRV